MVTHPYGYATPQPGYGTTPIPPNTLDGATITNTKVQNPANFVVNLLLTYQIPLPFNSPLKSLTADLNMQNILDERYYSYVYSGEEPVAGIYDPHLPGGQAFDSAFVGEPRSIMVDLTAKF
jgi:outer membrane receptor protein involved in Fe transport